MLSPWVFAGTMLAGSGLFAYSIATQQRLEPERPSLEPSPMAARVLPPQPPAEVVEPVSDVVEIPEVVISRSPKVAAKRPVTPPAEPVVEPAGLKPCSDWRELGPASVSAKRSQSSDYVSVRSLCP